MVQNVIPVSEQYKIDNKDIETTFGHNITIKNLTTGQDLTEYVDLQTLKIEGKKTAFIGLISADTATFDIVLDIDTDINSLIKKGDKIEIKDTYIPKGKTTPEEIRFIRYAQGVPEEYENLEHRYEITVYDRIKNGLETKFEEHVIKINWYLCNNNQPEKSLAHFCAYQMGFTDENLLFEDITDSNGNYLIIPYGHFEKGQKVMDELREMVKSVQGNLFMNNEDKLILQSPFNEEDYVDINYTFDNNIVGSINKETQYAKYDRVQVNFDTFQVAERQVCWMLYNKNLYDAANDRANMLLKANQTSAWYKIEWVTPIVIEPELGTPEIVVEDAQGNDMSTYFNYEMEADQVGGKIRFHNLSPDKDIYIQRFKIYGKPLEKYAGNELSYTESENPQKTMTVENKWVQTAEHAEMVAKYAYHLNCKDRDIYRFKVHYAPFLAINNLVKINKRKIVNHSAIVTEFIHEAEENMMYTNVVLEQFIPYEGFLGSLEFLEATPNIASDKLEFGQDRLESSVRPSEGLPVPQPQNITATGSFRRIWIEWDEVPRGDLLGYNIYVTDITDPSNPVMKKYWADTNGYSFEAPNGHTFEIQVSTRCLAGESEKAGIVIASTQLLDTADYKDLSIVNAKIANGTIDDAKIANVEADKITTVRAKITAAQIENIETSQITVGGRSAPIPLAIQPGDTLFRFDGSLLSTQGLKPLGME